MDFDHGFTKSGTSRRSASAFSAAVNSEYATWISNNGIRILSLADPDSCPRNLECAQEHDGQLTALALSQTRPNLLALASASQVDLVDLNTETRTSLATGIGRTITSVTFSHHHANVVAIGHVDGSVCIWDSGNPGRPQLRLIKSQHPCRKLAFNRGNADILASVHDNKCHIWNLDLALEVTAQPVCTLVCGKSEILSLAWCLSESALLAISSSDERLRLFDLAKVIRSSIGPYRLDEDSDVVDEGVFAPPDDLVDPVQPISETPLAALTSMFWVAHETLLGLVQDERMCVLVSVDQSCVESHLTWSYEFERPVRTVILRSGSVQAYVSGVGDYGNEDIDHSEDALTGIWSYVLTARTSRREDHQTLESSSDNIQKASSSSPDMMPLRICQRRVGQSAFSRTSRQLQDLRKQALGKIGAGLEPAAPKFDDLKIGKSRTSSVGSSDPLSHTKQKIGDGLVSPMPFLSPNVPSRKVSPSDLQAVGAESKAQLEPLPRPSLLHAELIPAGLLQSGTDSEDSDDESFEDELQGSTTFLPGGINVPLPKACGALFTQNGQLLTFFPSKMRTGLSHEKSTAVEPDQKGARGDRLRMLFPTFGKLTDPDVDSFSDESGLESPVPSWQEELKGSSQTVNVTIPNGSTTEIADRLITPIRPGISEDERRHAKLVVSVYAMDDVQLLRPQADNTYRTLCRPGESGSQLCIHNALVASDANMGEVSEVWRIISRLLEDEVPLKSRSYGALDQDILAIAQCALPLTMDDFRASLTQHQDHGDLFGKLRWAEHPLGPAWLIRRLVEWAEQRADVQFLACMTAILTQADVAVPFSNPTAEQSTLRHLPTQSLDYSTHPVTRGLSRQPSGAIPVLHARAASSASFHAATMKAKPHPTPLRGSPQLSPPILENGTTPPWSWAALSRQSTSISTSGSLSPAMKITGSGIGSAIKQIAPAYAQCIAEKFSSYGTSPQTRQRNASFSNAGALSSSMPTDGWYSKSVSFAADTPGSKIPGGSWSSYTFFADEDDGNDSDKTIEDGSTPLTPKSPIGGGTFFLTNEAMFADESSGSVKTKLVPDDLRAAGRTWCGYYADLLRSWDMCLEAAEMEKAIGLSTDTAAKPGLSDFKHDGARPLFKQGWRTTACAICETTTRGMVQACTSCLHVSHERCIEEYITELHEEAFACPTGCGCLCSNLSPTAQAIPEPASPRPTFKRKASFTDPRRWRARVEGDASW